MAEWNLKPLGELVQGSQISYGIVQPGQGREAGVPIVRVKDVRNGRVAMDDPLTVDPEISERHRKTLLRGGEVLVSLVGTVGEAAVATEGLVGWNVARAIAVLRPEGVSSQWLRLALSAPMVRQQIDAALNTTVQATLNLSDLKQILIPVPSQPVREAIADVLGALDDKIAANTKLATTAHDLSEQLFRAALATDEPRVGRFWDLFTVEFGAPFKGAHFSGEHMGRPLIRIRDLKSHVPQVWTTEERVDEIVVEPGDVIAGMDGDFTPTAWFGERGVLNQRVCRLSSGHSRALTLQAVIEPLSFVEGYKTGTTVAHLNKGDLLEAPARLPSEEASQTFDRRAAHLLDLQVALHAENARLADTRDALLPALMSGRLRVEEAAEVAGL